MEGSLTISHPLLSVLQSHPGVDFIHLHWVCFSGILRVRVLPKVHALRLANNTQGFKAGCFAMLGIADASLLPRSFLLGTASFLYPYWSSVCIMSPKHASVMCAVSDETDCEADCNFKVPFRQCPRTALHNLITSAQSDYGLSFQVGFELEFYLIAEQQHRDMLASGTRSEQTSFNHWSVASAMRGVEAECIEHCVRHLEQANIPVIHFHAEGGQSQFEISTAPDAAIRAVDRLIQSQEIIRSTVIKHGFRASFLPRPFAKMSPSGLHLHLSLTHSTDVPFWKEQKEQFFLAGIMSRLHALCAFGMPSEQSYERLLPTDIGLWVSWGTENRDCPVRKIRPGHWEFRAIDGTANMYWTLAAYIAAGLSGIKEKKSLSLKDCRDFLSRKSQAEREDLGIWKPMPRSLVESMTNCKAERDILGTMLGKDILDFYFMAKEGERDQLAGLSPEEVERFYLEQF